MSERDSDRPELSPGDETLVRRVRELLPRHELDAERRVAVNEALDRRIERRRGAGWKLAGAAAATVAVAALLLLGRGTPDPVAPDAPVAPGPSAPLAERDTREVDALLALAETELSPAEDLPEDYEAIASLVWGG
ncbi:MAG: hypothetical protein MJE66_21015 [Proteobacteria bacterium]|nr:hypothetical protein [Pseudomonadota bacterium]